MNRIHLIGNLGADPELKYTQGGQAVLRMRVATSKRWKDKQTGETKEQTEWHTCSLWGPRAEGLSKYVGKGDKVGIEGEMRYRQWENKDGVKMTSADVIVDEVHLLGGRRDGGGSQGGNRGGSGGGGYGGRQSSGGSSGGSDGTEGGSDYTEDDLPFGLDVSCEAAERWWPWRP